MALAIEMVDITKRFGRVVANDRASLRVPAGTIHALVGENGGGKTTLMNVLFGHLRADGGRVRVHGREARWTNPAGAMAAGLGMVHQEYALVPCLTVAENVTLGIEPSRAGLFDRSRARRETAALAESAGLAIDPDARVGTLPVGMQQRVEILKALHRRASVLILDEPTSVLSPPETEELFLLLRRLQEQGTTILLITHRVPEVLALAERVTVMRRGRTVAEEETAALTPERLASLMVEGDPMSRAAAEGARVIGDGTLLSLPPVIELRDVHVKGDTAPSSLHRMSLRLGRGEIVGVAAVEGNGALELAELLTGLRPSLAGEIIWEGKPLGASSPPGGRRPGVSYIPGDRDRQGIILSLSLAENLLLGRQWRAPFARHGWLRRENIREDAARHVTRWDIVPPDPRVALAHFSGGNRQRALLAREFAQAPRLLVAVHPSRGLDQAGTRLVRDALLAEKERGAGVLLVSADLDEILEVADRVIALYRGHIVRSWLAREVRREELGRAMTGASAREPGSGSIA